MTRDVRADYARIYIDTPRIAACGASICTGAELAEEYGVDPDDLASELCEAYAGHYPTRESALTSDVPRAWAVLVLKLRLERVCRALEWL